MTFNFQTQRYYFMDSSLNESEQKVTKVEGGIQKHLFTFHPFHKLAIVRSREPSYQQSIWHKSIWTFSPLFVFDTKAKYESKYCIDPVWCKNFPRGRDKYGTDFVCKCDLFFKTKMRNGWSTFSTILKSNNPSILSKFSTRNWVWPSHKAKIKWLLIIKIHNGSGWVSKEEGHQKEYKKCWKMRSSSYMFYPMGPNQPKN